MPVGAFVAEFKGLSATAKRKQIAATVPGIKRISDLAQDPEAASLLLREMKAASVEPKVTILDQVPEAHYAGLLHELYGVERHWYRHGGLVHEGIPWHIEVIVAETSGPGEMFFACNYAVSFGDPLAGARLTTAEVSAFRARSFLARCDAAPDYTNDHCRAAVVHITCAAPVFTDKGKSGLVVPREVEDAFARVLWQAGKDLHREDRAADRAARTHQRAAEQARKAAARPRMTKKEAVFQVIPEAVRQQRGGTDLPFSCSPTTTARSTACGTPGMRRATARSWTRRPGHSRTGCSPTGTSPILRRGHGLRPAFPPPGDTLDEPAR